MKLSIHFTTIAIKIRGLYNLFYFFTVVNISERFVIQTIYVLTKEILQFLSLKSGVYNQERVMAHVRYDPFIIKKPKIILEALSSMYLLIQITVNIWTSNSKSLEKLN